MQPYDLMDGFELIYVVVDHGQGSKVLQKAKKYGISGGTICHGRGTVNSSLLHFLSLYEERKEVVLLGADSRTAREAIPKLDKTFKFAKPHHGILFSVGTCEILGSRCNKALPMEEGEEKSMYQIIITVVNRGRAEDVIDAAKEKGSKGGTIINARGSGVNETTKLFNMDIEPEKEVVMILSKKDIVMDIVAHIREKLNIDTPGNGIIFIQDVKETYGVYE